MEITYINMKLCNGSEKRLRAVASITIDDALIINEIKIIETEKRLCIAFPQSDRAKKRKFESLALNNSQTRNYFETVLINHYLHLLKEKDDKNVK